MWNKFWSWLEVPIFVGTTVFFLLFIVLQIGRVYGQTRMDLGTQTKNPVYLVQPPTGNPSTPSGNFYSCMDANCSGYVASGFAALTWQTNPPVTSGLPCPPFAINGSSPWAIDTNGYFYVCSVPVAGSGGQSMWLRSAVPMVGSW